jgi:hypothetical protein
MDSVPVLGSLLALSVISIDRSVDLATRRLGSQMTDLGELLSSEMAMCSRLISGVFDSVRNFIATLPTMWQSPFKNTDLQMLSSVTFNDHPDIQLAASWVLLRLGNLKQNPSFTPHHCLTR